MIIRCVSFGSLWWLRPGPTAAHSAVFNTTGFVTSSTSQRRWITPGVIRFNVNSRRRIERYDHTLAGAVYSSPGLERLGSWNRVLLQTRLPGTAPVDKYLVQIASDRFGRIRYDGDWRSDDVRIVAASSRGMQQETLLLMTPLSVIETSLGTFDLPCILNRLT
jgi:hypothetical protein